METLSSFVQNHIYQILVIKVVKSRPHSLPRDCHMLVKSEGITVCFYYHNIVSYLTFINPLAYSNTARTIIDYVNSAENTIFVQNVTQMVSQIMDNLIYSSGGILPMLSSATSRNVSHMVITCFKNEQYTSP